MEEWRVVVLLMRCQNKCQIPEILKVWPCIRPSWQGMPRLQGAFSLEVAQKKVTDTFTVSQSSQSSHHLGCEKISKKVPVPLTSPVSSEVALDVLDLAKKVSPNYSLLPTTRPVQHRNVLLTMRAVKQRNVSCSHSSCSCTGGP